MLVAAKAGGERKSCGGENVIVRVFPPSLINAVISSSLYCAAKGLACHKKEHYRLTKKQKTG
jgi:hypothetical protein